MDFQINQIWRYVTRPGEEWSLAMIGHIDPTGIHCMIINLNVKGFKRGGRPVRCVVIAHRCFSVQAFEASVTELVDQTTPAGHHLLLQVMKESVLTNAEAVLLFKEGYARFYRYVVPERSERTIAGTIDRYESELIKMRCTCEACCEYMGLQ